LKSEKKQKIRILEHWFSSSEREIAFNTLWLLSTSLSGMNMTSQQV